MEEKSEENSSYPWGIEERSYTELFIMQDPTNELEACLNNFSRISQLKIKEKMVELKISKEVLDFRTIFKSIWDEDPKTDRMIDNIHLEMKNTNYVEPQRAYRYLFMLMIYQLVSDKTYLTDYKAYIDDVIVILISFCCIHEVLFKDDIPPTNSSKFRSSVIGLDIARIILKACFPVFRKLNEYQNGSIQLFYTPIAYSSLLGDIWGADNIAPPPTTDITTLTLNEEMTLCGKVFYFLK